MFPTIFDGHMLVVDLPNWHNPQPAISVKLPSVTLSNVAGIHGNPLESMGKSYGKIRSFPLKTLVIFPWIFHGFSHGFSMVFPWFSHGFSMVFPWFSIIFHDFPLFSMIFHYFPWFSWIFPWIFHGFSMVMVDYLSGYPNFCEFSAPEILPFLRSSAECHNASSQLGKSLGG